jgi:serine/threonine protein kinase
MPLSAGTRIGFYEVLAPIGAGGMGVVYKARDTRLERDVALKVLPDEFARDAERRARFEREARALASQNHPNIATIHGVEEPPGLIALVMELVEGETLAERIRRSRVPLPEALGLARQIANAIEAAHGRGIIHRDLKPANIKVTPAGVVKVLDFGLAKAIVREATEDHDAPTELMAPDATRERVAIGSAGYMSPEQARGRPVDVRTDVWGFGCVLFELITGRRAFEGDTIAAMLASDPDWTQLPGDTPDAVRRLLARCLAKDPATRLRDIADARLELDEAEATPAKPTTRPVTVGRRLVWPGIAVAAAAGAALVGWSLLPIDRPRELRLEISSPLTADPWLAVSPDGRSIVFAGRGQLLWRSFDSVLAQPLRGTEGARAPFWSPDGRSIGFFADNRLKRYSFDDGSAQSIVMNIPGPGGASWNREGVLLYAPNPGVPILRLPPGGGEPAAATRFEPKHGSHLAPVFLPDGRHFLFYITAPADERGVYLGRLDTLESRRLFSSDGPAAFSAASGHLFFVRSGRVLAQAFDPIRLQTNGDPRAVSEDTGQTVTSLSVSASGPIAYRPVPVSADRQFIWLDRAGKELKRVTYTDQLSLGPALSHDGRRIAVFRSTNGNVDIWSYDTDRDTWDRLTDDLSDEIYPLWSANGKRLVFGSRRQGTMDLFWTLPGIPGSEERLISSAEPKFPMDLSRDGRWLLYNLLSAEGGMDIWALPLEGVRTPVSVVRTASNEQHAQFHPDGKWIAYQSTRTGRFEIYIRPFQGSGPEVPVSRDGGAQPRWHPNGTELYYIAADDQLTAVPVRPHPDGTLEPGVPKALFPTIVGSAAPNTNRHQYMVAPSGTFVMNSRPLQTGPSPIVVILNWAPGR